ncbi:Integrase [Lysobacter dokdonensis DS-58]|uniref:Integrase n=1 Tax=Lysobacter dokdonensis DS-58 TaxID=1300345 RepID=A0A0A2WI49_9GAMM|nr:site-specific integrase [Lysobacter dokdonensis]KGQ19866.1 Integrase [Lysobacter dokdonensis DS-58]
MATLYKRGDAYYLNWRKDGTQLRRSLGKIDRREAEAIRAEKEAELAGLILPRSGRTVAVILQDYLDWSKQARPDSFKGTNAALRPLIASFGGYPAEELDAALVERWAAQSANAAATVVKSLKMARAAYRRAQRLRLVADSPFARVELPKVVTSRAPPYFTRKELDDLFKAERGAIWQFMANTGLRRSEMAKATREDVRDGKLFVESLPTGRTKSGKWRWVPLNKEAKDALKRLGPDRLVDCHKDTLNDWFTEDKGTKVKRGTPHWLRHSFCTYLAQAGVSLHDIKELAGHSSITMTEKYSHHAPGAGQAAIGKLNLTGVSSKKAQART